MKRGQLTENDEEKALQPANAEKTISTDDNNTTEMQLTTNKVCKQTTMNTNATQKQHTYQPSTSGQVSKSFNK